MLYRAGQQLRLVGHGREEFLRNHSGFRPKRFPPTRSLWFQLVLYGGGGLQRKREDEGEKGIENPWQNVAVQQLGINSCSSPASKLRRRIIYAAVVPRRPFRPKNYLFD